MTAEPVESVPQVRVSGKPEAVRLSVAHDMSGLGSARLVRLSEAFWAVRMARFLNLLHRWESAEFNQEEAAELLGVSERTFRRWTRRYEEEGEAGLLDRRLGKASGKRVPVDRAEEVERLYRERCQGFTVKHFHEHLVKDHSFGWG